MGGLKGKMWQSSSSSKRYDVSGGGAGGGGDHHNHSTDDQQQQQQCGILCFKGGVLQRCAHIKYFVAAGSVYTLAYVMVNLYLVGIITTIEKRFGFSSSSSGMLLSIKELAMVCSTLLMTHLARNLHKPRFLSIMGLCGAAGSALSLIPHFVSITKSHSPSTTHSSIDHPPGVTETICVPEQVPEMINVTKTAYSVNQCHQNQGAMFNHVAYSFFAVAAVVIGLSYCSVTALITTYVDDAASTKNNGIYLGIMIAMKPVGPLLAFVLGAIFTSVHESLLDPGYGAHDPRWVGAWWLGYILCPSFLVLSSIFIAMFPRRLPHEDDTDPLATAAHHRPTSLMLEAGGGGGDKAGGEMCDAMGTGGGDGARNTGVYIVKPVRGSATHATGPAHGMDGAADNMELMEKEIVKTEEPAVSVRMQMLNKRRKDEVTESKESLLGGLFQSLGRLMRNLVFVLLSIGLCFTAFIIAGMLPFFPKYLEEYFNQTAPIANMLAGFTCFTCAALGVLLGGLIVSHFELNTRSCCLFILATDIGCVLCMVGMMLCGCTQLEQSTFMSSGQTCDKGCTCSTEVLQPICGSNGITYMSPCEAGCYYHYKNQTYTDCQCIGMNSTLTSGMVDNDGVLVGHAVAGVCSEWCPLFIPYLILASLAPLFGMMASVPAMTIILRTVKPEDRSLGISFTSALVSLASFVPAPLVFGSLIDSSCSEWQTSCGERGACVLYDNESLRYRYHGASALFKSMAALMTFFMWIAARRRVVHNTNNNQSPDETNSQQQQQQQQQQTLQQHDDQNAITAHDTDENIDSNSSIGVSPTSHSSGSSSDSKAHRSANGKNPHHKSKFTNRLKGAVLQTSDFSPNEREDYPHGAADLFETVIG